MKQKVMDAMQSFSRALMGPVLFLPIAGMLQAISSVMSNTALVTEGGVVWTLGKFINGGVGAVIGNLGVLFCVGIAMSLAKKRKADAAFLALVSYLVWLAANARWLDVAGLTIAGDTASALYGTGQTATASSSLWCCCPSFWSWRWLPATSGLWLRRVSTP